MISINSLFSRFLKWAELKRKAYTPKLSKSFTETQQKIIYFSTIFPIIDYGLAGHPGKKYTMKLQSFSRLVTYGVWVTSQKG